MIDDSNSEYKNLFYRKGTGKGSDFNSQAGGKKEKLITLDETSFHSDMPSNNESDISAVPIDQRPGRSYYEVSNHKSNSPSKRLNQRKDEGTFEDAIRKDDSGDSSSDEVIY